ncbi:MAG TPA: hypothetical protein VNJ12_08820 [Candidatus Dormibacteraeota bacterium]|nr:hypothetical protein [Candidatus Dormibacteraeota bacterium]
MRRAFGAIILLAAMLAPGAGRAGQNRARELAERTLANQHKDDAVINDYERVEERVSYEDHSVKSDQTYRLVPTGTGRVSLLLERGGQPVDLATYRKEIRDWQKAIEMALDPENPAEGRAVAKRRERDGKRKELIDAVGRAFDFQWLGEKVVDGRKLAEIGLDPNPSFQPTSRETEMLRHVRVTVWIDERAAQLVRGRAEIISPISIVGGILAQIYPGGWFEIEQAEAAPGLWVPRRIEFSIRGRILFVSVSQHKLIKAWGYRYVGSPQQALELARQDMARNALFSPKP